MRSFAIASALLLAGASAQGVTGALGDAAIISDNPEGAYYEAILPNSEKTLVRGKFVAATNPGGKGVRFQIDLNGLPETGGPFAYHLHSTPVPADGNCTGALAHLDPYQRGQPPAKAPCDKANPQTCEVGDLSGKHGAIESTAFVANFVDEYASLKQGIGAFFGNRSIVIHYANSTRITCANFTQLAAGAPGTGAASSASPAPSAPYGYGNQSNTVRPTGAPAPTSSPSATSSPPAQQTGNAATAVSFGAGAVLAAVAALVL